MSAPKKKIRDRFDATEKPYFFPVNNNPIGRNTADCVIRGMAAFLDWSWKQTFRDLCAFCEEHGYMPNYVSGYRAYLICQGFGGAKKPQKPCTVKEFLDQYAKPDTSYLLFTSTHMTCIRDKRIFDSWDCSQRKVQGYWEKTPLDTRKPLYDSSREDAVHWAPSEEQMRALKSYVDGWPDNGNGALDSLYKDLEKLMK